MIKRLATVLLTICLAFSIVACSDEEVKDIYAPPVRIEEIDSVSKESPLPKQASQEEAKSEPLISTPEKQGEPVGQIAENNKEKQPGEKEDTKVEEISDDRSQEKAEKQTEATPTPETTPERSPEKQRILFVGDSRTIDMFADSDETLSGAVHDGITVYAKHGYGFDFMKESVNSFGTDNFDILISWMGANDHGNFDSYRSYYSSLIESGKTVILCTVGPTDDEHLVSYDHPNYENVMMLKYNESLLSFAKEKGIKVIDLYTYISNNISIDPADGIHYTPRPTTSIWNYIRSMI
ncbi:MAG: hypothetical protein K6A38_09340 [Lachnospiraceae bacterium]|nr:hypothetical protein [Lachnospiraceae bacterium]